MCSHSRAREADKKARELTSYEAALESTSLPGKPADCSNKDPAESEFYLLLGGRFSGRFC